jgi:type IV fimbrial biogenesis protein FimT
VDHQLSEHLDYEGGPVLRGRVDRASGFTIIEMIVAVSIFSILVALTVPTMRKWIANTKVRAVADALQNGVRLAQAESLRRSRQVVFALTNSTTPQSGFTAATNGTYWAIMTVPAMTDGSETPAFVEGGVITSAGSTVQITGQAEICFNSVGRLVANGTTGVAGGSCTVPAAGINSSAQPMLSYVVTMTGAADHPLQLEVGLGGQVHICDPSQTLSATNPYGC